MTFQATLNSLWRCVASSGLVLLLSLFSSAARGQVDHSGDASQEGASDVDIETTVRDAFAATHDGWSSDEVILQDALNEAFVIRCQERFPDVSAATLNWTLLNLRKAGKLDTPSTRRGRAAPAHYRPLAEIAGRTTMDRHQVSIDQIMTDPALRAEFDACVRSLDVDAESYLARKAVFHLRKARRLRPELITRIADWGREVNEYSLESLQQDLAAIPETPGVYIFKDATGYLYVGEAIDLRARLSTHMMGSDRASLARYLAEESGESVVVEVHTFDPESRIREIAVRRAYESELIRSRQPRFNIRP